MLTKHLAQCVLKPWTTTLWQFSQDCNRSLRWSLTYTTKALPPCHLYHTAISVHKTLRLNSYMDKKTQTPNHPPRWKYKLGFALWGPSLWQTLQKFWSTLAGTAGGLEIVFNQQLTRLGFTSLTASLPQAQRWCGSPSLRSIYIWIAELRCKPYGGGWREQSIRMRWTGHIDRWMQLMSWLQNPLQARADIHHQAPTFFMIPDELQHTTVEIECHMYKSPM